MSENAPEQVEGGASRERSLSEIIDDLTWEDILADGFITTEEVAAALRRCGGVDLHQYDHLYD